MRSVADPRLGSLVITEVKVTDDLSVARVRVRQLADDDSEQLRREVMASLQHAAGRLRRLLAPRLRLRRAPQLQFYFDTGPDAARRVEQLLAEINNERS